MSNIDKRALRERYSEKPAPNCHICGSLMTFQRAGAGGAVYGCTGRIDKDGEGYKFSEGRDFADDHYARSRVTFADESDPDVLALLDELEAAEKLNAELIEKQRLIDICQGQGLEHRIAAEKRAEAADKRIAELQAREVKVPELKMLRDYLAEVTHREREDILVGVRLEFFRALEEAGVKASASAGKGE